MAAPAGGPIFARDLWFRLMDHVVSPPFRLGGFVDFLDLFIDATPLNRAAVPFHWAKPRAATIVTATLSLRNAHESQLADS